jgi:hypothetical protein
MAIRWQYLLMALPLLGCSKPPAPPAVHPVTAEHFYSRVGKSSLVGLKWPDGHAVVVWTDIDGFCGGGVGPCPAGVAYSWSHREVVTRREPMFPESPPGVPQPPRPPGPQPVKTWQEETGRDVMWRCETSDGLSGRMTINGQSFDLTKGNLFLVSTAAGRDVAQLIRDLSGLEMTQESIADLAKRDETIRKFVAAAAPSK